ncbi:SDR family NAD(P)-dependent oxidoreductase [Aurantiacibacter gilvus]|uniref:SDR family oxidoreductase n=1 Tax=Aurantiacibacter gilvus TaxID=3139141 RepID=A0ABU9IF84_9SPHN
MTRQLAMEGAPHGIRANTISPGFILTEATSRHMEAEPALKEKVLAKNMLKRLGEPEDIAFCAIWLASDEACYVTGGDFPVDSGAAAW